MSAERDELALELFIGDNFNQPRESSVADWQWYLDTGRHRGQVEHYRMMAEAALAAGYRKPQQVTTPEELNALPAGSLLLSHSEYPRYAGTVWRVISGRSVEQVGREAVGVTRIGYFKDPLPAAVLHVGGAE